MFDGVLEFCLQIPYSASILFTALDDSLYHNPASFNIFIQTLLLSMYVSEFQEQLVTVFWKYFYMYI